MTRIQRHAVDRRLRIGELALQTDVTVETLRYYERRGLLPSAGRRESGYREYPPETARLVRFIKRAQSLGFTLTEVLELVRLHNQAWAGDAASSLRTATVEKIRLIDARVRELRVLRRALATLVAECDSACPMTQGERDGPSASKTGSSMPNTMIDPLSCPLVDALEADEPRNLRRPTRGRRRSTRRSRSGGDG